MSFLQNRTGSSAVGRRVSLQWHQNFSKPSQNTLANLSLRNLNASTQNAKGQIGQPSPDFSASAPKPLETIVNHRKMLEILEITT